MALLPLIVQGADRRTQLCEEGRKLGACAISASAMHACTQAALETAQQLLEMDSKSARWIGNDAVRDLNSETTTKATIQ